VPALRVAARTSSFAFKGKNVPIRRLSEELQVSTVLEGSVRKAGNRLRITAQLINAADGYHLWSERYDREMADTFAIQDEGEAKGREVREYIVLVTKTGEPNKRGSALLKKLMLECGLDTKAILGFKFPEFDSKSFGDFKKLLDQPLLLTIKHEVRKAGQHAGKTFPRVDSFKAPN